MVDYLWILLYMYLFLSQLTVGERKKSGSISLNHLLNFTIAPRERYASGHIGSSSSGDFSRRRGKKHHDFNKEQFLQAK